MEPFRVHRGLVAPLGRDDVDTDQIVPKQFLKRVERSGFGEFLFHDWRREPGFVLDEARYRGASVLVAGRNFGCGSSREHAPWALRDFGFRAVVATSFADIFANNCAKNGLVAVALAGAEVAEITRRALEREGYALTIDLVACRVADGDGVEAAFPFDAFQRRCLLDGLDEIALTLAHEPAIAAYEACLVRESRESIEPARLDSRDSRTHFATSTSTPRARSV
jgi:3-isopropylmalate/(R)-2-methylmalate dehydratase small subunit